MDEDRKKVIPPARSYTRELVAALLLSRDSMRRCGEKAGYALTELRRRTGISKRRTWKFVYGQYHGLDALWPEFDRARHPLATILVARAEKLRELADQYEAHAAELRAFEPPASVKDTRWESGDGGTQRFAA
jgi:hypothetical protein